MKKLKKVEKIGYHSQFFGRNRECNTERGFKNQLYIELGKKLDFNHPSVKQFGMSNFHGRYTKSARFLVKN